MKHILSAIALSASMSLCQGLSAKSFKLETQPFYGIPSVYHDSISTPQEGLAMVDNMLLESTLHPDLAIYNPLCGDEISITLTSPDFVSFDEVKSVYRKYCSIAGEPIGSLHGFQSSWLDDNTKINWHYNFSESTVLETRSGKPHYETKVTRRYWKVTLTFYLKGQTKWLLTDQQVHDIYEYLFSKASKLFSASSQF